MGWQEETVAKMQSEKAVTDDKENIRRDIFMGFWNKFVDINNSLLPELKFSPKNYVTREGFEKFALEGKNTGLTLTILPQDAYRGAVYSIDFYNSKGKLFVGIGESNQLICQNADNIYSEEPAVYYRVNSSIPEIIMKNLCMNVVHPSTGLEHFDYNHKTGRENTFMDKLLSIFK